MNVVLRTAEGRYALRFERNLPHPPERVWQAITEPEELATWFPFRVRTDYRVGGEFHWLGPDGEPQLTGTVTEWDPPRRWANETNGETMRFEIVDEGDGCKLIFTHIFDDRAGSASFATGWHGCLDGLAAVLDGGSAEPPSRTTREERNAHYVREFRLDEGELAETPDGVIIRFERVLSRPVDDLWAALTDGQTPQVGETPPTGFVRPGIASSTVSAVDVDAPAETLWGTTGKHLSYAVNDDREVHWDLVAGPGGARVTLTETAGDDRDVALAEWKWHLETVAQPRDTSLRS